MKPLLLLSSIQSSTKNILPLLRQQQRRRQQHMIPKLLLSSSKRRLYTTTKTTATTTPYHNNNNYRYNNYSVYNSLSSFMMTGQQRRQRHRHMILLSRIQSMLSSTTTRPTTTNASTKSTMTEWPSSIEAFVRGTPIITRSFPIMGRIYIDFGTFMMNFGAITSLSGFMMTDVIWLRSMSIVGSFCGITYNITRIPKQINAVLWGLVFVTVNIIQIVRLIIERREIIFTMEESALYYKSFEPYNVDATLYKKMLSNAKAVWKTYHPGQIIVHEGKPLKKVHILIEGSASCYSLSSSSSSQEEGKKDKNGNNDNVIGIQKPQLLYTYTALQNGSIIGATGLIDPSILGTKNYPNRIVANEKVRVLTLDTEKLHQFITSSSSSSKKHKNQNHASIEAAILRMMFVDLIGSLRRQRHNNNNDNNNKQDQEPNDSNTNNDNNNNNNKLMIGLGMALHDLKIMLQQACADGIIHPLERKLIREFMEQNNIHKDLLYTILQSKDINWTKQEWEDGAKHNHAMIINENNNNQNNNKKKNQNENQNKNQNL